MAGNAERLYVTYVEAYNGLLKIWGQPNRTCATYIEKQLLQLVSELNRLPALSPSNVQKGMICIAKYEDESYHRARIISDVVNNAVLVLFIDYGNKERVDLGNLRMLGNLTENVLSTIVPQAEEYYLANIKSEGGWSQDVMNEIRRGLCYSEYKYRMVCQSGNDKLIQISYRNEDYSGFLIKQELAKPVSMKEQIILLKSTFKNQSMESMGNTFRSSSFNQQHSQPSSRDKFFIQNKVQLGATAHDILNQPGPANSQPLLSQSMFTQSQNRSGMDRANGDRHFNVVNAPPKAGFSQSSNTPALTDPKNTQVINTVVIEALANQLKQHLMKDQLTPAPEASAHGYVTQVLDVKTTHNVYISYIDDGPWSFSVQLVSNEHELNQLMEDLAAHSFQPIKLPLILGSPCIAKSQKYDNYCRGVLVNITHSAVKVFYVDFGNTEDLPYNMLFEIPPKFFKVKTMSQKFALSGLQRVKPTKEIKKAFVEVVENELLILHVTNLEGENLPTCDLYLKDVNIKRILNEKLRLVKNWEPVQFPRAGEIENVLVTCVESPQRFFVQLKRCEPELRELKAELAKYGSNAEDLDPEDISPGAICISYHTREKNWYRGVITAVNSTKSATVFYVDYGYTEVVDIKMLRKVCAGVIAKTKVQAIPCCLHGYEGGFRPSSSKSALTELILGKEFSLKVVSEGKERINVQLFDNGKDVLLGFKSVTFHSKQKPVGYDTKEKSDSYSSDSDSVKKKSSLKSSQSFGGRTGSDRMDSGRGRGRKDFKPEKNKGDILSWRSDDRREIGPKPKDDGKNIKGRDVRESASETKNEKHDDSKADDSKPGRYGFKGKKAENIKVNDKDQKNMEKNWRGTENVPGKSGGDGRNKMKLGESINDRMKRAARENEERGLKISETMSKLPVKPENTPQTGRIHGKKHVKVGSTEEVLVTYFVNPNEIYVQLASCKEKFRKFMLDIRDYYSAKLPMLNKPKKGDVVMCKFKQDGVLYRAIVIESDPITVRYVDFGNEEISERENLWPMDKKFLDLESQCVKCVLPNLKPIGSDTWPTPNCEMDKIFEYESYSCTFLKKLEDGFEVKLVNLYNGRDVRDELISAGFAYSVEDPVKVSVQDSVKISIQDPVKVPVKDPVKVPVKDSVKVPVKVPVKDPVKVPVKDSVKVPVKDSVKISVKDLVKDSVQGSDQGSVKDSVQDSNQDSVQVSVQDSNQDSFQVSVQDSVQSSVQDPFKVSVQDSVQSSVQDPFKVSVQDSVQSSVQDSFQISVQDSVQVSARDSVQSSAQDSFQISAQDSVQVSTQDSVQVSAQDSVQDSSQVSVQDSVQSSAQGSEKPNSENKEIPLPAIKIKNCSKTPFDLLRNEVFNVFVTHIVDASEFYIQIRCSESKALEKDILKYVGGKEFHSCAGRVNVNNGNLCLVNVEGGTWYRAQVSEKKENNVTVSLIDYGYSLTVNREQIGSISNDLAQYRSQAVRCCLLIRGDKPIDELNKEFSSCVKKNFSAFFHEESDQGLKVTLYDTCGEKLKFLNNYNNAPDWIRPISDLPIIKRRMQVAVSHINSPKEVYVQLLNDVADLKRLISLMMVFYSDKEEPEISGDLSEFEMYAVRSLTDGTWYRAQLISQNDKTAKMFFLDFGNSEEVERQNLKKLDSSFYEWYAYAKKVSLNLFYPRNAEKRITCKIQKLIGKKVCPAYFLKVGDNLHAEFILDNSFLTPQLVSGSVRILKEDMFEKYKNKISGEETKVYISHVSNPGEFWVHEENICSELTKFQDRLQEICSNGKPKNDVVVGDVVGALFKDNLWYRALITAVGDSNTTIRFLDYGNTFNIDTTQNVFIALNEELRKQASFARKCSLQGSWKKNASFRFEDIVLNNEDTFDLIEVDDEGDVVDLLQNGSSVTEQLINEGYEGPENDDIVFITHINSPTDFFVQRENDQEVFDMVIEKMVGAGLLQEPYEVALNHWYSARFPEDDLWYRAKVLCKDREEMVVCFIDYGNCSVVTELKELPEDLRTLRPLSTNCCLVNLRPKDTWSEAARNYLWKFLNNVPLKMEVVQQTSEINVVRLTTESGEDLSETLIALDEGVDRVPERGLRGDEFFNGENLDLLLFRERMVPAARNGSCPNGGGVNSKVNPDADIFECGILPEKNQNLSKSNTEGIVSGCVGQGESSSKEDEITERVEKLSCSEKTVPSSVIKGPPLGEAPDPGNAKPEERLTRCGPRALIRQPVPGRQQQQEFQKIQDKPLPGTISNGNVYVAAQDKVVHDEKQMPTSVNGTVGDMKKKDLNH